MIVDEDPFPSFTTVNVVEMDHRPYTRTTRKNKEQKDRRIHSNVRDRLGLDKGTLRNIWQRLELSKTKPKEVWDRLEEPSGKFDYFIKYTSPPLSGQTFTSKPTGWDVLPEEPPKAKPVDSTQLEGPLMAELPSIQKPAVR